jgi:hypothetical protein
MEDAIMENTKKILIDAEKVIVNLIEEDKKKYITLERLERLINYIHRQLVDRNLLETYDNVIFKVNFEAIERTVLFNNMIFELIGNTIYLKQNIPDEMKKKCFINDKNIQKIIKDFVGVAA